MLCRTRYLNLSLNTPSKCIEKAVLGGFLSTKFKKTKHTNCNHLQNPGAVKFFFVRKTWDFEDLWEKSSSLGPG